MPCAVSTRSSLKVTSDIAANADCSAFAKRSNKHLHQPKLDIGERSLDVDRRLGAVGTEHRLDHREHEIAVEHDENPGVPLLGIENRGDGVCLIFLDDVPDAPITDAADGKEARRPGHRLEAIRAGRGHAIEDHIEHRHAVDGYACRIEQVVRQALLLLDVDLVRHHARAAFGSGSTGADLAGPAIVSFSTTSIDGRSAAAIILRPCSTAICGMAPFMKASRVCLTMM